MEKIIAKDLFNNSPDKLKIFKEWGEINRTIIKFQNNANLNVFKFIFGDNEGERLWNCFVLRCNRKFDEFNTFLIPEQINDLLVNIYYNENMYFL